MKICSSIVLGWFDIPVIGTNETHVAILAVCFFVDAEAGDIADRWGCGDTGGERWGEQHTWVGIIPQ
jgi:hypothetical protein